MTARRSKQDLKALRNLISEAHGILATTTLCDNASQCMCAEHGGILRGSCYKKLNAYARKDRRRWTHHFSLLTLQLIDGAHTGHLPAETIVGS